MNSEWIAPLLTPLVAGLMTGGVLAWILGRRIDPTNLPPKPSTLARTAMWLGISATALLAIPQMIVAPFVLMIPGLRPTTTLAIIVGPPLLAYAVASAALVMAFTAVARRDRRYATWIAIATAAVPFVLMSVIAIAVLGFGFQF